MRILWITNIVFPEAEQLITGDGSLRASGGWLLGSASLLCRDQNVKLAVAAPTKLVQDLSVLDGEKIRYYLFPLGKGNLKYNRDYESYWKKIKDDFLPDVVHIHGTEFTHGLAYVNACGASHVVVSIQGLMSAYRYYHLGLSNWEVIQGMTIRDLIKGSIFQDRDSFKHRASMEKELILKVAHVIGRTSWDAARVWQMNSEVKYHMCNETLRSEFYSGPYWTYDKCCKHSIFLSQAAYPIKGLHQLLKALPFILKEYPDTIVKIAGDNITQKHFFKGFIPFISGYGNIIKKMIKSLHLEEHICFVGNLNAEEMKLEYLKCNVFVCPSSVENSPNSVGEAQILGTPCVCSYVGGIPDMMKGDEDHLYRFEEISMLARCICDVLSRESSQTNMRNQALIRHNGETNVKALLNIYTHICQS